MKILSKREQHKIDFPNTPTVNQYRSYPRLCYGILNDVAGRGDNVAMRWMKRADYRTMMSLGTGPKMLRHTGDRRMKTLDPKIAAAIMRKAIGELGRRLTYHTNHCLESEDRTPKGRELWYIITQYLATTAKPCSVSRTSEQ